MPKRLIAAILAASLLLACGCSENPAESGDGAVSATPSAAATPEPSAEPSETVSEPVLDYEAYISNTEYYPLWAQPNTVITYDAELQPTFVEGGLLTEKELAGREDIAGIGLVSTEADMKILPDTKVEYDLHGFIQNIYFAVPGSPGEYRLSPATDVPDDEPTAAPSAAPSLELAGGEPYLAITYGAYSDTAAYGYDIRYYAYGTETGALSLIGTIPFSAQYAVGTSEPASGMIYYSQRSSAADASSSDYLCAFDPRTGGVETIDDSSFSYNDITLVDTDTLLVTSVSHEHTIHPAIIDIESGEMTFLPYADDEARYSTRTTPLNYNYLYGTFINVYVDNDEFESLEYRRDYEPIDHYIAITSCDPGDTPDMVYSIPLSPLFRIGAAAQFAEDKILLCIRDNSDVEVKTTYHVLDFSGEEPALTQISGIFGEGITVSNLITLDGGRSYICSGYYTDDDGGLQGGLFRCEDGEVTPILLNSDEGHVINFSLSALPRTD